MSDFDYSSAHGNATAPKKRFPVFIRTIAVLLVLAILSMIIVNQMAEPTLISRLSRGVFFGYKSAGISPKELDSSQAIQKPTEKEATAYSNYARQLSERYHASLNPSDKAIYRELQSASRQVVAHMKKIHGMQKGMEQENQTIQNRAKGVVTDKTISSGMSPLPLYSSLTLVASSGNSFAQSTQRVNEQTKEEELEAAVLNQISIFLYLNGYPDLAATVTSMAASQYPFDAMTALSFGTFLREANANDDAFHVLQYALRLLPDSEPILYSLGMCALDLKKASYARSCFEKILSADPTSGPGHQGMMLCYMDAGNYPKAFRHMLEGAREGYTSMVTEVYKTLREKNEQYFDFAEPILKQYGMQQLINFSSSRTDFDSTLTTPAAQLSIPRDIQFGTDSAAVLHSSATALNDGMQYCMEAFSHMKVTFDDAFSMIQSLGGGALGDADDLLGTVSKNILKRIFDSAASGTTVSNEGWLSISYESEVFWLNILDDYVSIHLNEYMDEYITQPFDAVFEEDSPIVSSLVQYTEMFGQRAAQNPYAAADQLFNNLLGNNSIYDKGTQKAHKQDLDKYLQTVHPKLDEGYQKTAELLEEYWLHYGKILAKIGNDETYNRYQQARKTTVASALTPYIVGATANCFMVTMNLVMVDPNVQGGGDGIKIPQFPQFPGSQMGDAYTPPRPPAREPTPQPTPLPPEEEPQTQEPVSEGEDPPSQGEVSDAPTGTKDEGEIATEKSGTLFIGPISVTLQESGFELDATAVGSFNVRFNRNTGDLSLFGGVGLGVGAGTSGVGAKKGIFGTINTQSWKVTSGTRIAVDGQLAGNGMGYEQEVCFATGVKRTTLSAILLHRKSSQTITE